MGLTQYQVPHTVTCLLLGVSLAWFYKWIKRADGSGATSGLFTDTDRRRDIVHRWCMPAQSAFRQPGGNGAGRS